MVAIRLDQTIPTALGAEKTAGAALIQLGPLTKSPRTSTTTKSKSAMPRRIAKSPHPNCGGSCANGCLIGTDHSAGLHLPGSNPPPFASICYCTASPVCPDEGWVGGLLAARTTAVSQQRPGSHLWVLLKRGDASRDAQAPRKSRISLRVSGRRSRDAEVEP